MSVRTILIAVALAFATAARAQPAEIAATVRDQHGKPLADAIVVAVPRAGGARPSPKPRDDAIFQVDREFVPKVSAVVTGTAVSLPNNDSVRHHVYSFSPAKKFELPLYQGVPARPVVFDKPGVVILGCNIHDWMVAYVYVSESPHFAKTDAQGKATIADLPSKTWIVRVWHPQHEGSEASTRRTVDVGTKRRVDVAWSLEIKPETSVPRAPSSKHPGSY